MPNTIYPYYMAAWSIACLIAIMILIKDRQAFALAHENYWRFLFQPWKVITFLIAGVGLAVIAPYTGDPTWDYIDAAVMSILTFVTAPWVVGALYKTFNGDLQYRQAYVAICLWLFTASWFYDAYILLRDGDYTKLWLPNMFASSALYLLGGLFWNLEWREGRGTIFGFMEDDWPSVVQHGSFARVIWIGLIFMGILALMILPFLFDDYFDISWLFGE
jgi:hypothetical protein